MLATLKARLNQMNLINEADKKQMLNNILMLEKQQINILITGATGSGKSSTINALFATNIAKIGMGVDPETMDIQRYTLDNLVIWDSPGFGDGIEQDKKHARGIKKLLLDQNEDGSPKIDLILMLLDGGSRDYGTSYDLLENVIIPFVGKQDKRILVAINQADMAMNGKGWDHQLNQPTDALKQQLENKVCSTQKRIKDNTGVDITPIFYSAGYQDEFEAQRPYNLSKLLYFIVKNIPSKKRIFIADNMNMDKELYEADDRERKYSLEVKKSFVASLLEVATNVTTEAVEIMGHIVTTMVDTVGGVFTTFFNGFKSLFGRR